MSERPAPPHNCAWLLTDRPSRLTDTTDLSFTTLAVLDVNGDVVPNAANSIAFAVSGAGELVATDNGDPYDMTSFPSTERKAFSGLALAIVRGKAGLSGSILVTATAAGLTGVTVAVMAG